MITLTHILGWLGIGLAASLAALVWPFMRGPSGAVVNIVLGTLGSVLGPMLAIVIGHVSPAAPVCIACAAGGAIVTLVLGHLTWSGQAWATRPRRRRATRHA
jgi:uncharacterized membrane protein YeaQ/YmgE (transglycosylase-associated protein family)